MKKYLLLILALQLFATPGAVFAQQTTPTSVPQEPALSANQLPKSVTTSDGSTTPYAVISNESTDSASSESTGTLDVKNIKYSVQGSLKPSSYQIDYVKPFNPSSTSGKLVRKSTSFTPNVYNVGDSKSFWVSNLTTGAYSQISSRLAYSGSKANVWVYNNQLSDTDAAKLGQEFDTNIYSTVTNNFGSESDVNHDGKIDILCYDIQDGFSGSGAYVAGYFNPEDLYTTANSNQEEIFYIDTYPTMGIGSTKDVTQVYSTLAHEFQHMVDFNQKVLIPGKDPTTGAMDTWIDEGLSMAAEQIYEKKGLSDRLDYYNRSTAIQNGQSLLYWDDSGDVLSNYALSYLFLQYVKIQAGQGDAIFKDILQDPHNNYQAIEDVAKTYIDPNITFGKLMTDFRIALLLKQPSGLYGFKGDPFFDGLQAKIFTGSSAGLRGGGAVVTDFTGLTVPGDKGQDVSYNIFDLPGITPAVPASPLVNPIGDADTQITGASSTATVYAVVEQTEIGRVTNVNGTFSIPIPKQPAGTVIQVYAEDRVGNTSAPTNITVRDVTAPMPPTVNQVGDLDTVVTGLAEPGAAITITANGVSIGSGYAGPDGKFSVTIHSPQKAGTTLKIVASDRAKNTSAPTTIVVKTTNGWVKQNGTWYYYQAGKKVTGWLKYGTSWYYFDGNGAMKTGWSKIGTKWYYFDGSGTMKTGWLKLGTKWYYFDGNGVMKTGWLKSGTTWYYFNGNGAMVTGWFKSGTTWYYFNGNGQMATGWKKLGTSWYYFDGTGKMKTGWITISGKRYYFNSNGVWVK